MNFTGIMPCSPVINSAPINHLGLSSGERNAQSCQNSAKCFKTSKRGQVLVGSEVLDAVFLPSLFFTSLVLETCPLYTWELKVWGRENYSTLRVERGFVQTEVQSSKQGLNANVAASVS